MPRSYVSDIRDFLDDLGNVDSTSAPGARFGLFLGAIVAWATTGTVPRAAEPSNVVCGWRSGGGRCSQEILVDVDPATDEVEWACPACGTNGVVRGWEGTRWDRRQDEFRQSSLEGWPRFERALARLAPSDAREAALAQTLRRLALPAMRLVVAPSRDAEVTIGSCKVGGAPDLPTDEPWPEHQGQPLPFVAQLSLADLARFDPSGELPNVGHLWFFFDADRSEWGLSTADTGPARVIFRGKSSALLARREPPPDTTTYRSYRWTPRPIVTIPRGLRSTERVVEARERPEAQRKNPFTGKPMIFPARETLPGYREPADDVEPATIAAVERFIEDFSPAASPQHQVLGHPIPMQGSGHFGRRLATAGCAFGMDGEQLIARGNTPADASSPRWRLLLQLASECEHDRMGQPRPALDHGRERLIWADGGVIYWLIRDDDLAARRSDRVWVAMDCG